MIEGSSDFTQYPEWRETIESLTQAKGSVVVLGGMDAGKTTFMRLLVEACTQSKQTVAILDADLGQSEIGPPACVGIATTSVPVLALSDLKPQAIEFIGNTTPVGSLPEYLVAIRRLMENPVIAGQRLLIDTCGYVRGMGARRLIYSLLDLISPDHIVVLQRRNEMEPILHYLRRLNQFRLYTPSVPSCIVLKPPVMRRQRRAMRFASYFHEAVVQERSFDSLGFRGAWIGNGTPLASHLLAFVKQSVGDNNPVYYGEIEDRHLGLMVKYAIPPEKLSHIVNELKVTDVTITEASRLKNLLVGLKSAKGQTLAMGILVSIDFKRRNLFYLTPLRSLNAPALVHFGTLRVQPDGIELGNLNYGEF